MAPSFSEKVAELAARLGLPAGRPLVEDLTTMEASMGIVASGSLVLPVLARPHSTGTVFLGCWVGR